jgi:transposase InsO family protein
MRGYNSSIGLETLCGLFGITRQAYYNWINRSTKKYLEDDQVLKRVKAIRRVHPRIGCRKLYEMIKPDLDSSGIKLGRDKLFNLLSENQLLIRKRRRRVYTTNSFHSFKKYKNLIKEFIPYKAGQLWVSDITYIRNGNEFMYLFLITDAYSKKIVGYKLAYSLETKHAIESLQTALDSTKDVEGLIHHSDRGIQYCSHNYVKLLQDYKVNISMTEDSKPTDNSIAERVNGILKEEYIEPLRQATDLDLGQVVDQAILRYNQLRPHLSCDMKTPSQAHKMTGPIKKRWKNYYKLEPINN